jgi:hypothetical protein
MDISPDGEFVYCVNMESNTMSIVGYENSIIPLEGESCENAIELFSLTGCVEGETTCYRDDYNESCDFPDTGASDRVYSYTPFVNLHGSVEMCNSGYDTKIYIYENECEDFNSGNALYCNDDFCGLNGWRSLINDVTLQAGQTYYFVVDGYGEADKGNYELCFNFFCSSDFNEDGIISVSDLTIFIGGFGTEYNLSDLLVFLGDFGNTCNP